MTNNVYSANYINIAVPDTLTKEMNTDECALECSGSSKCSGYLFEPKYSIVCDDVPVVITPGENIIVGSNVYILNEKGPNGMYKTATIVSMNADKSMSTIKFMDLGTEKQKDVQTILLVLMNDNIYKNNCIKKRVDSIIPGAEIIGTCKLFNFDSNVVNPVFFKNICNGYLSICRNVWQSQTVILTVALALLFLLFCYLLYVAKSISRKTYTNSRFV